MKLGILSSTSRSEAKLWTELTSLWLCESRSYSEDGVMDGAPE